MNKLPFVTIIIPYKNNLDYLFDAALKSIFNQSYKNFKILIVYDDEDKSDLL
jgi:glycosyltransferase involved in cell wall biosynthesis